MSDRYSACRKAAKEGPTSSGLGRSFSHWLLGYLRSTQERSSCHQPMRAVPFQSVDRWYMAAGHGGYLRLSTLGLLFWLASPGPPRITILFWPGSRVWVTHALESREYIHLLPLCPFLPLFYPSLPSFFRSFTFPLRSSLLRLSFNGFSSAIVFLFAHYLFLVHSFTRKKFEGKREKEETGISQASSSYYFV